MIKYFFIPPGLQAKVENNEIILPLESNYRIFKKGSTFLCDVGNYLGDGIIDHHTLDKENECATTLVFSESKSLVDEIINLEENEYTVITHLNPDFDAIGCSYFVTKKIKKENISPFFKILANYILDVDLGKIHLDLDNIITPFSLILAINFIISKEYDPRINSLSGIERFNKLLEKNEKILLRSFELLDYILKRLSEGINIYSNKLFDESESFNNEIDLIKSDLEKYNSDHLRSEKYKIPLFKKDYDEKEEVDLLITINPESVLWKYWARGDRKNTKNGYIFTCAFLDTFKSYNKNRAIIAIDRTTDFTLKGLGIALDELEIKKIIRNTSFVDKDSVLSLIKANKGERRNKFHRNDPWFDERNEFTIIDSPRNGSILNNDEIKHIILCSDYWQMLSKKLVDDNNNFFEDIELLFPEIFIKEPEKEFLLETFFENFKNGIYDTHIFFEGLEKISKYLLSTNNNLIFQGIYNIQKSFLELSLVPRINNLQSIRINEIKIRLLENIQKALIKSSDSDDEQLQKELLKIIYLYFDKITLRNILPTFRIFNEEIFIDSFIKSNLSSNYQEALQFLIQLINKNDLKLFLNIKNYLKNITNKNQQLKILESIIDILIILKDQSLISYSSFSVPISSFDDWKDTIDDYIYFTIGDISDKKVTEFINKDSSFFLNPNTNIIEYNDFINNYNEIKINYIFNDDFWSEFIDEKIKVEEIFNKNNKANILKKYTKSYINECSLQEFQNFRLTFFSLIERNSEDIYSESLKQKVELIHSIKIFEDLLKRLKVIANINQINNFLSLNTINLDINNNSYYPLSPLLNVLFRFLKLLFISQYIPDINKYRAETQDILYEFSTIITNFDITKKNKDLNAFYNDIKKIFELINSKNSSLMKDYEYKISILDELISIINSDNRNIFNKIDKFLLEPERTLTKEIVFSLNLQFITERDFLIKKIRNNLKNEDKNSRNSLKNVLNDIISEATKDELRRLKQIIDVYPDQNIIKLFYSNIIKPFRFLSFNALTETNNKNIKNYSNFTKIVRTYLLKDNFSEKNLYKSIKKLKKKINVNFDRENNNLCKYIIEQQNNPKEASLLPECINIQTYEFLINHFLDKYSIEDAREKIEEYTNSKISKFFKFFTSWWILIILILLISFSFLAIEFKNNIFINTINGIILFFITFLPLAALIIVIPSVIVKFTQKNQPQKLKNVRSVYGYLISYSQNKINNLSFKLLLVEFIVPLALGILASIQDNNLLYGLLKISDFRLLAILPIIMFLSYFSLYNNISSKNNNFSSIENNKIAIKIYSILFFQAWFITVSLLNILTRYVFVDSTTFETDWNQIFTIGEKINFLGFDFIIFPKGAITITFISLFIGLFVESFNKKDST
jgi:hypothetical protein